jgi:hypothetical protein
VKGLGSPATIALAAVSLAFVLHPATRAGVWLPAVSGVVASLSVLLVLALAAAALSDGGSRFIALAALALAGAAGYDAVAGYQGRMLLAPGQTTRKFEEIGASGQGVGERPLGFDLGVETVAADGRVVLRAGGRTYTVTATQPASVSGFRVGAPRLFATGGVRQLRLRLSGPSGTSELDVPGDQAVAAGDLTIGVAQYFADLAMDENGQPFSRSAEPRKPAVLLSVRRGGETYRVFVVSGLPGIHQVAGLGLSFDLVSVEPERAADLRVARQPGVALVVGALVLAAFGLAVRA